MSKEGIHQWNFRTRGWIHVLHSGFCHFFCLNLGGSEEVSDVFQPITGVCCRHTLQPFRVVCEYVYIYLCGIHIYITQGSQCFGTLPLFWVLEINTGNVWLAKPVYHLEKRLSTYHEKKMDLQRIHSCTNFLHPRISIWPPRFLLERITRNSWSLTGFLLVVEKHSKNKCFKWAVFKRLVAFYTGWFIWYLLWRGY